MNERDPLEHPLPLNGIWLALIKNCVILRVFVIFVCCIFLLFGSSNGYLDIWNLKFLKTNKNVKLLAFQIQNHIVFSVQSHFAFTFVQRTEKLLATET